MISKYLILHQFRYYTNFDTMPISILHQLDVLYKRARNAKRTCESFSEILLTGEFVRFVIKSLKSVVAVISILFHLSISTVDNPSLFDMISSRCGFLKTRSNSTKLQFIRSTFCLSPLITI